jgi:hypothetical protein
MCRVKLSVHKTQVQRFLPKLSHLKLSPKTRHTKNCLLYILLQTFSLVVMVMIRCRQVGIYTWHNLQTQPLEQMYKDFLAGDQLLGNEGSNGDHGQSAIVQLLALHVLPGLRVRGEQTQGIESKVTRLVVVSQGVEVLRSWSCPSQTHSVCLAQTDSEQKWLPEYSTAGFNLLEMVDSRT